MKNSTNNTGLKIVIAILSALLLGSLGYIYKMTTDVDNFHNELAKTASDKESILKNLQALKMTYDEAILEKTSMSDELVQERDKVITLINDLNHSKGDLASLEAYKKQYTSLNSTMKVLINENQALKKQNELVTQQRDSAKGILLESQKNNLTLSGKNHELSKEIEKGSKLTILNQKVAAFRTKSSGKQVETDIAVKTDLLKIYFTIAENQLAKSGDKLYYVQIIDSNNNVLGDKKTISFGDKRLTYSFLSNVKYENKTVEVSETLTGKNFVKGDYYINIYDKDNLISKATFMLK
jgi:Tfp pilus assembly protein PilO